jgi:Flp pilus assembly protein TadG
MCKKSPLEKGAKGGCIVQQRKTQPPQSPFIKGDLPCMPCNESKERIPVVMKKLHNTQGIAALEFALILPFLLALIFGIIEFSFLMYDKQVITNASREGARYGIVQSVPRLSKGEIEDVVNYYCANHLITFGAKSPPTITVDWTGVDFGDNLTVNVQYFYQFILFPKFVNSRFSTGINLTAETVMKYE